MFEGMYVSECNKLSQFTFCICAISFYRHLALNQVPFINIHYYQPFLLWDKVVGVVTTYFEVGRVAELFFFPPNQSVERPVNCMHLVCALGYVILICSMQYV
jgi:hypothetical protein